MNPTEILRIVDAIHRAKNIDPEIVFQAIEAALVSAVKKHYGDELEVEVNISREDGTIVGTMDGQPLDPDETVGRIGAQTAKQIIIQKIREAERDALYDEYQAEIGQMLTGVIHRYDGRTATVQLSNVEAILPYKEQIPGETHHTNERVRATVFEVRKQGSRVKVILSRTRPQLVQRLFEQEIPEIAEGVIEVRALSREPGCRSKVAVISSDQRVDCVGACVGVRGNRIKNIVDELAGERIDIVRWNDDLMDFIPNALQPAEIEEVILCEMLGRAIVLVREDQLSLAIGRRGQNVRLASKLCGWDIEIMTREELDEQIESAMAGFYELEGIDESIAERLVVEGYMTYDDLTIIEPDALQAMGELTAEQVDAIVAQAEVRAEAAEEAAKEARRQQREQARIDAATKELEEAAAREAAAAGEGDEADGESEEAAGEPSAVAEGDTQPAAEAPTAEETVEQVTAEQADEADSVSTDEQSLEPVSAADDETPAGADSGDENQGNGASGGDDAPQAVEEHVPAGPTEPEGHAETIEEVTIEGSKPSEVDP